MGTLYLTYWGVVNHRDLPIDKVYSVSNMSYINKPIKHLVGLKPGNLTWDLKRGLINWSKFVEQYTLGLISGRGHDDMCRLKDLLKEDDVYIVCCEKDAPCHRFILGTLLKMEGYTVKEIGLKGEFDYDANKCFIGGGYN